MILRTWSARATQTGADSYRRYFERTLLPQLRALPGFSGALLVSRDDAGLIDLIAHTFWESLDAIRAFAGDDYRTAVVEQEALVMLQHSDPEVVHRTVVFDGLT